MKITPYKLLEIKKAMEKFDVFAIPVIDSKDLDSFISVFLTCATTNQDDYNDMMSILLEEKKDWFNVELIEQIKALKDFFSLMPTELGVLIHQLNSISKMQLEMVGQMTKEMMKVAEQEQSPTSIDQS